MECVVRLRWEATPGSLQKLPFLGPVVIKVPVMVTWPLDQNEIQVLVVQD